MDVWCHTIPPACRVAVSSTSRPWIDVFALPEKFNMAVTESDPDLKVRKMTVRPFSWACGNKTEMLLILKKLFSVWLFVRKSYLWPSREMSTRSICGWNLFQPLGLLPGERVRLVFAYHYGDALTFFKISDFLSIVTPYCGAELLFPPDWSRLKCAIKYWKSHMDLIYSGLWNSHETTTRCWSNVGPPFATVVQHWTNIGSMSLGIGSANCNSCVVKSIVKSGGAGGSERLFCCRHLHPNHGQEA